MPNVFLDTNVLVYAAMGEKTEPRKWSRAVALMTEGEFSISAQVMAEFVHVLRRKAAPAFTEPEIDAWLDEMAERDHTPVDSGIVRRGAAISRRFRIAYYDGAILAAAERLGCDTVLSEDMADGQSYGSVTVRNPFRES